MALKQHTLKEPMDRRGRKSRGKWVLNSVSECVYGAGESPPHHLVTLLPQLGVLLLSSTPTPSARRQPQIPQVKGSVPQDGPTVRHQPQVQTVTSWTEPIFCSWCLKGWEKWTREYRWPSLAHVMGDKVERKSETQSKRVLYLFKKKKMFKVPKMCAERDTDSEPLRELQISYRSGVRRQALDSFSEEAIHQRRNF